MASLLSSKPSSRRSGRSSGRQAADVRLTATRAEEAEPDVQPYGPRYGWQLLAVGGALATAVAGWVIVAGLTVVGWLAADPGNLSAALHTGTRLWLLAHGTPARLGGVHWSLTPLAMSLVIAFMVSRFTRAAVRFADPEDSQVVRVVLGAAGLATVSYAAVVAAVGLGSGAEIFRGIAGAVVIAAVGGLWGAARAVGLRPGDAWPAWTRPLPVAVAAAVGVLLLSGVAVLATGVVLHADRIASLTAGLGAGAVGGVALWAAQAAFAPNIVIWCASYALGAGFRIGQGSVVAPSDTSLGLLPSFPVLGALPGTGPGTQLNLLWLVSGVAAGAVAAVLVVRRRPDARPDETSLVGGLAGVLAALIFTGLAWLTGGDLGDGRLAGAGPRMLELLVMSSTLLGLSGMICGLALGIVAMVRRRRRMPTASTRAMEDDDTVAVDVGPGSDAVTAPIALEDEEPVDTAEPEGAEDSEGTGDSDDAGDSEDTGDTEDTVVRERRSA